jgi:hypothetical protein
MAWKHLGPVAPFSFVSTPSKPSWPKTDYIYSLYVTESWMGGGKTKNIWNGDIHVNIGGETPPESLGKDAWNPILMWHELHISKLYFFALKYLLFYWRTRTCVPYLLFVIQESNIQNIQKKINKSLLQQFYRVCFMICNTLHFFEHKTTHIGPAHEITHHLRDKFYVRHVDFFQYWQWT